MPLQLEITLILLLIIIAYYFLKSVSMPILAIILIPLGSYMGYTVSLFENSALPFSLFQIFLLSSFGIVMLNRIGAHNLSVKTTGIDVEIILFLTLIFFSLIYSPNRADGLLYATRFFVLILMVYLILNTITKHQQIQVIIFCILLISFILGIISIRDGLLNPQAAIWNLVTAGKKIASRSTVTQNDPNIFATHFFIPILYTSSVVMVKDYKPLIRFICLLLFAIFFLSILSTFSRSAWISVILAIIIQIILFKQYRIIFGFFFIGLAALILIPNFQIIILNILNRFLDIFAGTTDESSNVRLLLGIGALEMFIGSFFWGVGFRGFTEVFPSYISPSETLGIVEPHNVIYTILAELGIFGLLIYLWIIWQIFRTAKNNFRQSQHHTEKAINAALLTTFIAYLIFYQFYGGGLVDNNFWIVVSLIFSSSYLRKIKA